MFRIFTLLVLLVPTTHCMANAVKGWPQGMKSYKAVLEYAVKDEKPLLIYFYTDWCPFCKRLNEEYIASPEFKELSGGVYKVQINPEKSKSSESLFKKKYKGTGYPSVFFYVPAVSKEPRQYHPFSKNNDLSPSKYTKNIREKIARDYNNKAFELYRKKEYENARDFLLKALTYDLKNRYALLLFSSSYHKEGYEKQDEVLLGKARKLYKKILKYYPGDKEALSALEQLGN